jgi:hypothetical protein
VRFPAWLGLAKAGSRFGAEARAGIRGAHVEAVEARVAPRKRTHTNGDDCDVALCSAPALVLSFAMQEVCRPEGSLMTTEPGQDKTSDVPKQVFEGFLQALGGAGASAELVARLRKTLLEEKKFTEPALKEAVLPEESLR